MKYFIFLILFLPTYLLAQGPNPPPDIPLLDMVIFDEELAEPHIFDFPPEFLTPSPIIGNCPGTHAVAFQYPRGCTLQQAKIELGEPGGNGYSITYSRNQLECRTTDEPHPRFRTGFVCQVPLPADFLTRALNRTRTSSVGTSSSFIRAQIPDPRFTVTLTFSGGCNTVSRTYQVISTEDITEPVLVQDWAECLTIENDVFIKAALAGSIEDGCYAMCGEENHTCSSRAMTLSDATGSSLGGNIGATLFGWLNVGAEYQRFDQTGAEITINLPVVTISAEPGEICVPLFDLKVDQLESRLSRFEPGSCTPVPAGTIRMVRPEPGAGNVSYDGESKHCFPVDCEQFRPSQRPAGRPIFESLPGELKFEIRFEIDDPFMRGAIDIEWDDLEPDNPYFIENVPAGTYCYTITNSCCDEVIQDCIELCPDLEVGDWNIDSENGSACREIICPDGFQSGGDDTFEKSTPIVYNQCEALAFGPYEFDQALLQCRREIMIESTGEIVGYETKEPTVRERYDEATGNCVREYFCGGNVQEWNNEYGAPLFGNWQFDEFNTMCYREITCFGRLLNNQYDTKEPTYEWDFNNFTGNCEGTVLCDGSPVFSAPQRIQFPINYGFWDYDFFSKKCVRTVNCEFGPNGEAQQQKDPTYTYTYDDFGSTCERQVVCDGFPVFGAVESFFPSGYSDWDIELGGLECNRTVRCEFESGSWVEQTARAEFTEGIKDPRCPGTGFKLFYFICDGEVTDEYLCQYVGGKDGKGKEGESGNKSLENLTSMQLKEKVYPNPFDHEIVITLDIDVPGKAEIILSDIVGREVARDVFELVNGRNAIHFNTDRVRTGMYNLRVIDKETNQLIATRNVVKK